MSLLAFGLDISFFETVVGSVGGIIANLRPINGLGSFGTFELGWVAGYAVTGHASLGLIAAAGLTMHFLIVIISGALASVAFFMSKRERRR